MEHTDFSHALLVNARRPCPVPHCIVPYYDSELSLEIIFSFLDPTPMYLPYPPKAHKHSVVAILFFRFYHVGCSWWDLAYATR